MKQYVVDQLRSVDFEKLKAYLDRQYGEAALGGVYWVPLDSALLSPVQSAHGDCQPFYVALQLEETALSMELLVRTKNRIRCGCIAYATAAQRVWMMDLVDGILARLGISV